MSENITHTAVLDDCFRLMAAHNKVCDAFREVMRDQVRFARLGGITRRGDFHSVGLLTSIRQRWDGRSTDDKLEPKLAFILGWLTHRAADRQMKPIFREVEPGRPVSPAHSSVHQDAFIFHEVYQSGKANPYHPQTFADTPDVAPGIDAAALEELIRVLLQRALIELHTLIPDDENIEGWLENLFDRQQRFYVDRERYAQAVANPDPEWVRRGIEEVNFYDRDEPIIQAARAIQHGQSAGVVAALAAEARSHYAQALKMGCGYILAASDFFSSDMAPAELEALFNIGKPGRDGMWV